MLSERTFGAYYVVVDGGGNKLLTFNDEDLPLKSGLVAGQTTELTDAQKSFLKQLEHLAQTNPDLQVYMYKPLTEPLERIEIQASVMSPRKRPNLLDPLMT